MPPWGSAPPVTAASPRPVGPGWRSWTTTTCGRPTSWPANWRPPTRPDEPGSTPVRSAWTSACASSTDGPRLRRSRCWSGWFATTRSRPAPPTSWSRPTPWRVPALSTRGCATTRTGTCGSGWPASAPPAWVCRPLVALRVHPGNASQNMDRMLQELDVIERRHRIPVDRAAHYRWAAWSSLQAGRRRAALRYYAHAVRIGDLRSIARAVVTLTHPAVAQRRAAHPVRPGSAEQVWIAEAQSWLDPL